MWNNVEEERDSGKERFVNKAIQCMRKDVDEEESEGDNIDGAKQRKNKLQAKQDHIKNYSVEEEREGKQK